MNTRTLLLGSSAIAAVALVVAGCGGDGSGGGGLLKGAGDLATAVTGDERYSEIGDTLARTITDYNDLLPSEEHYIGRAVAAQVLVEPRYPVRPADALTDYVALVGQNVAQSVDFVRQTYKGYRFTVLESDELNAFATPGGFVFITTGLLKQTRSEDELAGILAHEIAHVTLKHGLSSVNQSNFVQAGQLGLNLYKDEKFKDDPKKRAKFEEKLGEISKVFGKSCDEVAFTLLSGGYGADKERAADELAIRLVAAAGYAPTALSAVLDRLPEQKGAGGWLDTHPSGHSRAADLHGQEGGVASATTPAAVAQRTQRHAAALKALQ
jgi:predicted Zn-dependent protease